MIFRHEFSVRNVCRAHSIQATHACHSEVLTGFFGIFGLQSASLWPFFGPSAPCFHVTKTTVGSKGGQPFTAERRFVHHDGHVCLRSPCLL